MLVEFSHRLTSGLALVAVVALLVWVLRPRPGASRANRRLALGRLHPHGGGCRSRSRPLQLVADNESVARAMFMAVHLVTPLCSWRACADGALAVWWTAVSLAAGAGDDAGRRRRFSWPAARRRQRSGGGTGDTLFPAQTLAEALASDVAPTSHLFVACACCIPASASPWALPSSWVSAISAARRPSRRAGSLRCDRAGRRANPARLPQRPAPRAGVDAARPLLLADALVDRVRAARGFGALVSAVRRAAPSPALTPATR